MIMFCDIRKETRRTYLWPREAPERAPEVGVDEEAICLDEGILSRKEDAKDSRRWKTRQGRAFREDPINVNVGELPHKGGCRTNCDIHDVNNRHS